VSLGGRTLLADGALPLIEVENAQLRDATTPPVYSMLGAERLIGSLFLDIEQP